MVFIPDQGFIQNQRRILEEEDIQREIEAINQSQRRDSRASLFSNLGTTLAMISSILGANNSNEFQRAVGGMTDFYANLNARRQELAERQREREFERELLQDKIDARAAAREDTQIFEAREARKERIHEEDIEESRQEFRTELADKQFLNSLIRDNVNNSAAERLARIKGDIQERLRQQGIKGDKSLEANAFAREARLQLISGGATQGKALDIAEKLAENRPLDEDEYKLINTAFARSEGEDRMKVQADALSNIESYIENNTVVQTDEDGMPIAGPNMEPVTTQPSFAEAARALYSPEFVRDVFGIEIRESGPDPDRRTADGDETVGEAAEKGRREGIVQNLVNRRDIQENVKRLDNEAGGTNFALMMLKSTETVEQAEAVINQLEWANPKAERAAKDVIRNLKKERRTRENIMKHVFPQGVPGEPDNLKNWVLPLGIEVD